MKKLFNNTNITYKFLILFSVIIGIYSGIVNRIPFLNNTSFQDIAVYIDFWIVFAIFIIMNAKNTKDAMLKCFLFFIISQPLIYITEALIDVIFKSANFWERLELFINNYYIDNHWFLLTLLTVPGAFIAYQVKKDNILSSLILSVATCALSFMGIYTLLNSIFYDFPYHLLSGLFSLFMAFYLVIILLNKKRNIIIGIILTLLASILGIIAFLVDSKVPIYFIEDVSFERGVKSCLVEDEDIARCVYYENENYISVASSVKLGETNMRVIDEDNNIYYYEIVSKHTEYEIIKK